MQAAERVPRNVREIGKGNCGAWVAGCEIDLCDGWRAAEGHGRECGESGCESVVWLGLAEGIARGVFGQNDRKGEQM